MAAEGNVGHQAWEEIALRTFAMRGADPLEGTHFL